MAEVHIAAEPRTEFGKGAARRLRGAGKVPAVLYGHGAQTDHLALPVLEFAAAIRGDSNAVITIEVNGKEHLALPRSIVWHPLKDYLVHVDLLAVRRGEKVTVEVPVHLVGEAGPGTLVLHDLNTLSIEVDALAIPERIEVSIDSAEPGTHVTAGNVPLPAGATLIDAPDTMVVAINAAPTASDVEEEEAAEAAAADDTAEAEA